MNFQSNTEGGKGTHVMLRPFWYNNQRETCSNLLDSLKNVEIYV